MSLEVYLEKYKLRDQWHQREFKVGGTKRRRG